MGKNNILETIEKCPVCDSTEFTLIKRMQYPEGVLRISRCNICLVSFSSTRFSNKYLNFNYYNKDCEELILGTKNTEETSNRFVQDIVNKVKKLKKTGKWLDIGCGKGYLLDIASKNNFDCYGIDIYDDFIKNEKIKFFNKTLFETNFNNGEFDVISMINVLDHLDSPGKHLRKVYNLLNSNGILYIHVPNEFYFNNKIVNKVIGRKTEYRPDYHIVNYSEMNIRSILKRFNFSKVEFVSPKYKNIKGSKKRILLYLLELFNNFAIKWDKAILLSMQVMVYK